MRTWWENEAVIEQFRDWLDETREEAQSLADVDATKAAGLGSTRTFLSDEPLPEVGFLQLVETLTAVRQEIKLQTKSQRGLQDAAEAALNGLQEAMRKFESVRAKEDEAALRAGLPLVESLVGLDEAMLRGMDAFESAHGQLTDSAPGQLSDELDAQFQRQPWWRRWAARRWHEQVRQLACAEIGRMIGDDFAQIMQGYSLIRSRLGRSLREQGVERIETLGRRVDPAAMTVVALVSSHDLEPETVAEEVRPGYRWKGRVIRFAEVRAVANRIDRTSPNMEEGVNHGAHSWD
ncbi:MAG: nucleotide exchange factor GrpE [Patescibacteria group bacterium]|nr:nucleotide exchange factor GrpE [Patescibacteria group bacterium]